METQDNPPPVEELVAALKLVIRKGLPLQADFTDIRLLGLRGVVARAINPHDRLGRVKALDELLARLILNMRNDELQKPATLLFGIAAGSRGTLLTIRRERAAQQLSRDVGRFRRAHEPQILETVAWDLHRDSQNYIARAGQTELPLESSGMTPSITAGDLASIEAVSRAEWTSRVWASVYALRTEVLRVERLRQWPEDDADPARSTSALQSALSKRDDCVRTTRILLQQYIDRYGQSIEHGNAKFNPQGLLRLAGWAELE